MTQVKQIIVNRTSFISFLTVGNGTELFRTLSNANKRSHWITTVFMKYVLFGFMFSTLSMAVMSVIYSLINNDGTVIVEELLIPYRLA